jgi:LacI family transcriptional regulator
VVNGRPDVSTATRARVHLVIEELGYRPNGLARSLLRRTSRTIGLVVTDCTNPNTARQLRVVQQAMARAGYAVMIFDTQERSEQQRAAISVLEEQMVDGVILMPAGPDDTLAALARRVPVVLINREIAGVEADTVLNDNATGARLAVEHLLGLGHRRIAYVTAKRDISTVRDRLAGYRAALEAAGVSCDERLVERAEIAIPAAAAAANRLLKRRPAPTAIFAYNDFMAVGVLSALHQSGRRVPEEVALVGYDDIVYAAYLQVPLTTVAQQTEQMGAVAAGLLLERLAGSTLPRQRVVLEPRLIVRASTGGER